MSHGTLGVSTPWISGICAVTARVVLSVWKLRGGYIKTEAFV